MLSSRVSPATFRLVQARNRKAEAKKRKKIVMAKIKKNLFNQECDSMNLLLEQSPLDRSKEIVVLFNRCERDERYEDLVKR